MFIVIGGCSSGLSCCSLYGVCCIGACYNDVSRVPLYLNQCSCHRALYPVVSVIHVFSLSSQAPAEQTKCPLTLKEMVKPMKSKICGHNYDQDAIMQHISRGRGRAKCPVCGQLLTKADLEHNTVLEHSIKRKNRRK